MTRICLLCGFAGGPALIRVGLIRVDGQYRDGPRCVSHYHCRQRELAQRTSPIGDSTPTVGSRMQAIYGTDR